MDPLVRGMDPRIWIRIWIRTKISWIRNTGFKVGSGYETSWKVESGVWTKSFQIHSILYSVPAQLLSR